MIRVYERRFRSNNLNTYQICSIRQVLQTNGNTIPQYSCFQLFIDDGNTLLSFERVCSDSQCHRKKPNSLAVDFIDDAVWNVGTLGQYPTCYTHGALLTARQLISVANTSLTIRVHRFNTPVLETNNGTSVQKNFSVLVYVLTSYQLWTSVLKIRLWLIKKCILIPIIF